MRTYGGAVPTRKGKGPPEADPGIPSLDRDLLYEVGAADPVTFLGVVLFFSVVALVACLLPALKAWRVDPVVAFRTE